MWEELISGRHLLLAQCQAGEALSLIATSICLCAAIPSRALSPTLAFARIKPSLSFLLQAYEYFLAPGRNMPARRWMYTSAADALSPQAPGEVRVVSAL